MNVGNLGWKAAAAYLYLLELPDSLLAWEYLRRNARYRAQWNVPRVDRNRFSTDWGLCACLDPSHDGRDARPTWREPDGFRVRLIPDDSASGARFDVWAVAGRKLLLHDGIQTSLRQFAKTATREIVLDEAVADGIAFGYALPAGIGSGEAFRALLDAISLFESESVSIVSNARPSRQAVVHMHALQALDATHAGASHRQTAIALFGEEAVSDRWEPDSDLRARVRHLIRRGRQLRDGGYLQLVAIKATVRKQR